MRTAHRAGTVEGAGGTEAAGDAGAGDRSCSGIKTYDIYENPVKDRAGAPVCDEAADAYVPGEDVESTEAVKREFRRASSKALKILLSRMRTEKELLAKLSDEGFSDEASAYALNYCRYFGYVNDFRYAENFIMSMKDRKSHAAVRRELMGRGVDSALIDRAFDEFYYDDADTAFGLIFRKNGEAHRLSDQEVRRTYGYLARRGFSPSQIWAGIHRYQDEYV